MRYFGSAAFAALAAAIVAGGAGATPPPNASLTIQHQQRGCHSWAVNGGALSATQKLTLSRGGAITLVNNDVMPHRLVQLSGPKITIANLKGPMNAMGMHIKAAPGYLTYMGASARISFPARGTYVFKTRAGEDYAMASNVETIGEDNVLRLTVTVK